MQLNEAELEHFRLVDAANKQLLSRLEAIAEQMQQDEALSQVFIKALNDKYGYNASDLVFVVDDWGASIQVRFQDPRYKHYIPYSKLGYLSAPFDIVMEGVE